MKGIHLSLVGLHLSVVGGFWALITHFMTVSPIDTMHHLLLWGGLVLSLVGLLMALIKDTNE